MAVVLVAMHKEMALVFGRLLRKAQPEKASSNGAIPAAGPSGPPGARAYAIGDVHGRLDLLKNLLHQIRCDMEARPCPRAFVIFLGDLVDRGPDSRGVVELLMQVAGTLPNAVFLKGNHEEMLLRILEGEDEQIWSWLSYGGYECAQSYGVEVGRLAAVGAEEAAALVRRAVPPSHRAFMEQFADSFRFGSYLFVHAGIRPGVPLEAQSVHDLRWIRDDFVMSAADHAYVVVHGHTISEGPDERHNRIGIDTGAYTTGVLTALRLEGAERSYLVARGV